MDYVVKRIALSQLLLDEENSRIDGELANQDETIAALVKLMGDHLLNLAADIVEVGGLDPMTTPAVVLLPGEKNRYRVLEGNRRILALKVLKDPTIVATHLSDPRRKKLADLSAMSAALNISVIQCVVFESEAEAWPRIAIRHTGANGGVGLVEWGSNEIDRFRSRHGRSNRRQPAGQILDFVDRMAPPENVINSRIITNVQRIISSDFFREALGIEIVGGIVFSHFPTAEVYKGLKKIVSDLRSNSIKVRDVYDKDAREIYLSRFSRDELPQLETRLAEPIALDVLIDSSASGDSRNSAASDDADSSQDGDSSAAGSPVDGNPGSSSGSSSGNVAASSASTLSGTVDGGAAASTSSSASPMRPSKQRGQVIPRSAGLRITERRAKEIADELIRLDVNLYPNACAVLMRVFVELSVDHFIGLHSLMTENERSNSPLAKRLKIAAAEMVKVGKISAQLEKAIVNAADGNGPFSMTTLNQFVHNIHVFPKPSEILSYWDQVQPFVQQIWTR